MYSNFLLGKLRVTDAAKLELKRTPLDLVARHAINDHGLVTEQEKQENKIAMQTVDIIVSRYLIDPTDPDRGRVLVITDELWETTTVKLERET
jgi:hypothetical protein